MEVLVLWFEPEQRVEAVDVTLKVVSQRKDSGKFINTLWISWKRWCELANLICVAIGTWIAA